MSKNRITYGWEFNYGGVGCRMFNHYHRTPEAAQQCGNRLIRAARRDRQLFGAALVASVDPDEPGHIAAYDEAGRVGG